MDIGYSNFLFSRNEKKSTSEGEEAASEGDFSLSPLYNLPLCLYTPLIRKVAYVCIHNEMEICGNTTVQQKNEATKQPPSS